MAKGTWRVYISDFKIFTDWCLLRNIDPQNAAPEAVAIFLANQFELGLHPSTLNRRLAAIRFAYKALNKLSPTEHELLRATLKDIRRDEKVRPTKHKNPLTNTILINIIQHVPLNIIRGIRDRAVLLLLFVGVFRRSELIKLKFEDIKFVEQGLDIIIHRSKTNQEGQHQLKSIAKSDIFCPALRL